MNQRSYSQAMSGGARGSGWGSLLRDLVTTWRLLWDPSVPGMLKLVLPIFAMIYWISPFDLIPGIPIDDLAILFLAARLFVSLAPGDSVNRAFNRQGRNKQGRDPRRGGRAAHTAREDDHNVVDTTWRVVDEPADKPANEPEGSANTNGSGPPNA